MRQNTLKTLGLALLGAAAITGGCAEARREVPKQVAPAGSTAGVQTAPPTETVAVAKERAKRPLVAVSHTGSTVQLASFEGEDIALVVDEDARALRVVDADTLAEKSHVVLEGRPAQVAVAADGRAYVALRDRSQVVALEAPPGDGVALEVAATIDVATEPVALATTPAGDELLVTSAWGAKLASYDVKTHARKLDVALPREPRGVAVSTDGNTAHVAHAVGSRITKVSLTDGETADIILGGSDFVPRPPEIEFGCFGDFDFDVSSQHVILERSGLGNHIIHDREAVQGFAIAIVDDRVFVPEVLAHFGEVMVGGYGSSSASYPPHQPTLVVVDGEKTWLRVRHQAFQADKSRYNPAGVAESGGCFLPRAAASDPSSDTVLIGCVGTNEVRIIDTKEQTSLTHGTKARWKVPSGPTGIAVDEKRQRALVWSQFARKLSAIPLAQREVEEDDAKKKPTLSKLPKQQVATKIVSLGKIKNEAVTLSAAALKGRELFHGAGDRRISADGRSCESCHPDGREDGLTWPTPFGARQTPMLAGRLVSETVPFGWHGDAETVQGHLKQTLQRLGGTGLKPAEVDALVAYCQEMATPPSLPAADTALVAKGKDLFFADTVGCASCHKDGGGSDGIRHEVGSGPKLDTPSLKFLAGTAPYFHDGRYNTLAELLEHTQGTMGWGNEMTQADRNALEAYLRTL